jgi:hypothetical protein
VQCLCNNVSVWGASSRLNTAECAAAIQYWYCILGFHTRPRITRQKTTPIRAACTIYTQSHALVLRFAHTDPARVPPSSPVIHDIVSHIDNATASYLGIGFGSRIGPQLARARSGNQLVCYLRPLPAGLRSGANH